MLYVVNIMAHNEEATIEETINAVLAQELGNDSVLELHVFANACTDQTEDIVKNIIKTNCNVMLHSIPEKGKAKALTKCISYFKNERCLNVDDVEDRLFFMDADITIPRKDVLLRLSRRLDDSKELYLVSAIAVPESVYNEDKDFVSELFRIRYYLQYTFKKNLVRGACNVIRWSALQRLEFPEELVSTDMFLEVKFGGHFLMDHEIEIVTRLKKTLKLEAKRDLIHQIGREQVYRWRRKGLTPRLDRETAVQAYFLSPLNPKEYFLHLIKRRRLKPIIILSIWMIIYKYNSYRSKKIMDESLNKKISLQNYWSTNR